jgi:hypothetical protein
MESCKGKTIYEIIDKMEDSEKKLLLKYLKEKLKPKPIHEKSQVNNNGRCTIWQRNKAH